MAGIYVGRQRGQSSNSFEENEEQEQKSVCQVNLLLLLG